MERELRDELADSISKAVSDADRARIAELEKVEAELLIEVSKYVWRCAGLRLWDYALILKYTFFFVKITFRIIEWLCWFDRNVFEDTVGYLRTNLYKTFRWCKHNLFISWNASLLCTSTPLLLFYTLVMSYDTQLFTVAIIVINKYTFTSLYFKVLRIVICVLFATLQTSRGVWCGHDAGICSTGPTAVQRQGSTSFEETNTGPPGNQVLLFIFLDVLNLGRVDH